MGWADSTYATRMKEYRPVHEKRGEKEIVADHEDAHTFGSEFPQQAIQVELVGDIQVSRRLVKEQVCAELRQGASRHDALPLTAAELGEGAIGEFLDTHAFQAAGNQSVITATSSPPSPSMRIAAHLHDLADGEGNIGGSILRQNGDVHCHFTGCHRADREAIEKHGPRLGPQRPVQAS